MYKEVLNAVFAGRSTTRRDLGDRLGSSPAAVTKYVRWLEEKNLLISEPRSRSWSKRPVAELRINPDLGSAVAIFIKADVIHARLIRFDGYVIAAWDTPVRTPTQKGVLATVAEVVREAQARETMQIKLAGVGVAGYAANDTVFGIDGLEGWEPCQPGLILKALEQWVVPVVAPEIRCKLFGALRNRAMPENLVYVQIQNGTFRVAAFRDGYSILGGQGTTSPLIHRQVSNAETECFCGRKGCMAQHIRNGDITNEMLAYGVIGLLDEIAVGHVLLELEESFDGLFDCLCKKRDITFEPVTDSQQIVMAGLAQLTVQKAFQEIIMASQKKEATQ